MKPLIKKLLKENRFVSTVIDDLDRENIKRSKSYGIDPTTWYLGSQIIYKWWWKSQKNSKCIIEGSVEFDVLLNKYYIFNPELYWDSEEIDSKKYNLYCDIINTYYDLDNFNIHKSKESIFAFLDRFVYLVHLDTRYDVEEYIEDQNDAHMFGYQFNDIEESGDIGGMFSDISLEIRHIFKISIEESEEYLRKWTLDKVLKGEFH